MNGQIKFVSMNESSTEEELLSNPAKDFDKDLLDARIVENIEKYKKKKDSK